MSATEIPQVRDRGPVPQWIVTAAYKITDDLGLTQEQTETVIALIAYEFYKQAFDK